YTFSDFVCVAAIQFNLWVKHLMNSNEVCSHNVPVDMLHNQMKVIIIIQTSLQLFRELLGSNIGQTRNIVLSHNFSISPNEIYCMSILPHLCRSILRLDLVPHAEVRHWIGSFIYTGGMNLTHHGHSCVSV